MLSTSYNFSIVKEYCETFNLNKASEHLTQYVKPMLVKIKIPTIGIFNKQNPIKTAHMVNYYKKSC